MQTAAWAYHVKLGNTAAHAKGIIDINKRFIDRIEGSWVDFGDTGAEFAEPEHPYCGDLDIVGPKSLFQLLNTAHTRHGRNAFAADLLGASYSKEEIYRRQEAIKELAGAYDFTGELEYRFSKIGDNPAAAGLAAELRDGAAFIKNKLLQTLLTLMPPVFLILTGFVAVFRLRRFYLPCAVLMAAQSLAGMLGMHLTAGYLKGVSGLPFKLGAYSEVISLVGSAAFKAKQLGFIQEKLAGPEGSAARAMKELGGTARHIRNNQREISYGTAWDYIDFGAQRSVVYVTSVTLPVRP